MMRTLEKFDGQRLAFVRADALKVSCRCGHIEQLPITHLKTRYGEAARVRNLLAQMTCPECGQKRLDRAERLDLSVSTQMPGARDV